MFLPPKSIIASGPVIIENNKVLLNRENKDDKITPWFFPGGEIEDFDSSLEEACKREVNEEMGITIEILKPLRSIMLHQADQIIILIHYLAKRLDEIKPANNIADWGWFDIDNLPDNCASNVYEIIKDLAHNTKY